MAAKTILTHELCKIQKLNGAVINNDAKACFDRIIENMSNLACMREGLSPKIDAKHAQTFQQMRYYVKTKNGCGPEYNGHSSPELFHGSVSPTLPDGTAQTYKTRCWTIKSAQTLTLTSN
jgi:hypothetical protein